MNKEVKKILSQVIKQVIKYNQFLWEQLKQEIDDLGMRGEYPTIYNFSNGIEQRLAHLPSIEKSILIAEWNKANPTRILVNDTDIIKYYTPMILDEITSRAERVIARS